jgi:ABC-type multidrug transport system fused ATPase/permease subunit
MLLLAVLAFVIVGSLLSLLIKDEQTIIGISFFAVAVVALGVYVSPVGGGLFFGSDSREDPPPLVQNIDIDPAVLNAFVRDFADTFPYSVDVARKAVIRVEISSSELEELHRAMRHRRARVRHEELNSKLQLLLLAAFIEEQPSVAKRHLYEELFATTREVQKRQASLAAFGLLLVLVIFAVTIAAGIIAVLAVSWMFATLSAFLLASAIIYIIARLAQALAPYHEFRITDHRFRF